VHPEIQELQPKLKEVLYDCAVEIRATKAALYLFDGAARFELITEFGFRGAVRQTADRNDPVADRCGRGRSAFFINGIGAEPRFSEVLYEASTDRLLAAPIYFRGALVGFVDMRDKVGKQPFDAADLPKAQHIAERLAELFTGMNVFGQRFITLSGADESEITKAGAVTVHPAHAPVAPLPPRPAAPQPEAAPKPAAAPVAGPAPAPAPPAVKQAPAKPAAPGRVPRLSTLILEARAVATRVVIPTAGESLSENELSAIRDILRSILLIPGAAVVSFSAFGHMGGVQEVAARASLTDDSVAFLQSKLNIWLTKRGESAGHAKTSIQTPFGTTAPPIKPSQLQKVFTAPVTAGALRGLYLTVGFLAPPDRTAHELLATMLAQLQTTVESSMERGALQALRFRVAEKLLEPDFAKFPELRLHSDRVVARAEALARHLAMSQGEIDNVKLVARLHDVGMRMLDYDRLYRKLDLLPEEMTIFREHTNVGAAIVEPLLGSEIARGVLCHHERWDGRGYPNELRGEEIPRLSQVVQVCDVFETMVASDNVYQDPISQKEALSMIAETAGSQFDTEVAHRFLEMMR
jgi:HD domain